MPELSEILAAHRGSGCVVAPAGFGKTHLIAQAVSRGQNRQLVLTHTYAGVNVLRRKMRQLGVPYRSFHIDTIASWAFRLCLSYPATSRWTIERPSGGEWRALYKACSILLDRDFVRRVVRASYGGLYVDEYQDCSAAQHELILKLSRDLPCRVLGDPMQAIFDFDGQPLAWDRDVAANFTRIGDLQTPYRWNQAGSPAIGAWLIGVRRALEKGSPLDLRHNLPPGVTIRHVYAIDDLQRIQVYACRSFRCDPQESVVAIHRGNLNDRCHALAKRLGGRFSSIEEIEGKALFLFVENIGRARKNQARLKYALAFARRCMTRVNDNLPAATLRGEHATIRQNTRNPVAAAAANVYLTAPSSDNMAALFAAITAPNDVRVTRADLFNRTMGVLRKHMLQPQLTLVEAAERYHTEFRYRGRPVGRKKLVGTTLLVKGLEFDHAIILDAPSLSRKELYVALTRGAKSLTIISSSPVLNPKD